MPKGRLKHMRPRLRDLFGEIPVYLNEIEAWLLAIPRMSPDSPRAAQYIKAYDVVGKIRRAKESGSLEDYLSNYLGSATRTGFYWERFRWAYR